MNHHWQIFDDAQVDGLEEDVGREGVEVAAVITHPTQRKLAQIHLKWDGSTFRHYLKYLTIAF